MVRTTCVASSFRPAIVAIALLMVGCDDVDVAIGVADSNVFALADRDNAHVSLASDGDHVAAAWAASDASGSYPAIAATTRAFVVAWTESDGSRTVVRTRLMQPSR